MRREFLFFLASSTSTRAPRDREVLMTGIESAESKTKEAALVMSASVTAGLSFFELCPDVGRHILQNFERRMFLGFS